MDLEREIENALRQQKLKDILGLRNKRLDTVRITPTVSFFEGTPKAPIKHIASTKGHVVSYGLISLINFMGGAFITNFTYAWMYGFAVGVNTVPPNVPSIRLGTGNVATTQSTTSLSSPITTAPNVVSGSITNPSNGIFKVICNATWNAGTLGAPTIREAAIWIYGQNSIQSFGATYQTNTLFMADRISSADGDFAAFNVNSAKPLSCQYTLAVQYV
jgi:hypothetical protein